MSVEVGIPEYCKYAGMFRDKLLRHQQVEEQKQYETLAVQHFNNAFAEDEPDYGDVPIITPNPDYKP